MLTKQIDVGRLEQEKGVNKPFEYVSRLGHINNFIRRAQSFDIFYVVFPAELI